ncbi:hypothetical protein B0H16DRAFT_1858551 [Mycena metata]|uniref:F-box domain-containing protein n=1 Tax=Mycena metata TaxID=1033252 RepID=A0AAD7N3B5_9AGAR|nr:hypothetical protein B0H16DRAFT_1858551 [Mycena metata]
MLVTSIPELLIQILEHLSLRDLISASHVCLQWRALVLQIDSPTRLRLLRLAFNAIDSDPYPISLNRRVSYVNEVETKFGVIIPDPYRTILTEWPASQPPPGMHWPHSVRFHASGFCFCPRHVLEDPDVCQCADRGPLANVELTMPKETFRLVMEDPPAPVGSSHSYELFDTRVRLYTDEQNAQTLHFIRMHPADEFAWNHNKSWASFQYRVLRLSRYHFHTRNPWGTSDGCFVMMLEGPTRGEIHGWSSSGDSWYDGFEAESFWDWNYSEWNRDAVDDESGSEPQDSYPDGESVSN